MFLWQGADGYGIRKEFGCFLFGDLANITHGDQDLWVCWNDKKIVSLNVSKATHLSDVAKHIGVKCKVIVCDIQMALKEDVTNQGTRVICQMRNNNKQQRIKEMKWIIFVFDWQSVKGTYGWGRVRLEGRKESDEGTFSVSIWIHRDFGDHSEVAVGPECSDWTFSIGVDFEVVSVVLLQRLTMSCCCCCYSPCCYLTMTAVLSSLNRRNEPTNGPRRTLDPTCPSRRPPLCFSSVS